MNSCSQCIHVSPPPPYSPLHPVLFQKTWQNHWINDELIKILQYITTSQSSPSFSSIPSSSSSSSSSTSSPLSFFNEIMPGVFSFPFLTKEACGMIQEEVENYLEYCTDNKLPIHRPNSMNNYGVVLLQMGLHDLIVDLQEKLLYPISSKLFPVQSMGGFTSHHAFIVSYSTEKDTHLDMHTDDSDVTFNICLGKEGFTASGI